MIFKVAYVFLLFCIHRNHGQVFFQKIRSFVIDEPELFVSVRMGLTNLKHFEGCLLTVLKFFQNAADGAIINLFRIYQQEYPSHFPQAKRSVRQYLLWVTVCGAIHNFLYALLDIGNIIL